MSASRRRFVRSGQRARLRLRIRSELFPRTNLHSAASRPADLQFSIQQPIYVVDAAHGLRSIAAPLAAAKPLWGDDP
jgi:hypothetical protein